MTQPLPPSTFVDDPKAPEYFASLIAGVAFDHPNVRLTFASARVNHAATPGPVNVVVNARIVMSIQSAKQMVELLDGFLRSAELNVAQKPQDQSIQ
jgi:hypothetical protein